MKKVSFKERDGFYTPLEMSFLPQSIVDNYFAWELKEDGIKYYCLESFTAEITVKIVPYEPLV